MTARSWCFTLNNYTEAEIEILAEIECRYIVCGKEVGENNTPHVQGYIEYDKPKKFGGVKKSIPRAHIEQRKGTREQARDYCMKDNNFTERGDWDAGGTGRRTDLDKCRELAATEGMRAVTAICNLQQIKVAEKFLTYNEEARDWKPKVIWICGKTGSGKSRQAREICKDDTYTKSTGKCWWDGYDGHENVIIDDFRDSWWPITEMLSLLDRYEKQVEVKGGFRQFKPKTIIVTSIKSPEECYKNIGEDINQLIRRIDEIVRIGNEVIGNEVEEVILKLLDL